MLNPNFAILYVNNPIISADFYSQLLGCQPIESSPTFVLFALEDGFRLGLWSKHTVEPAAANTIGASTELAIWVPYAEKVKEIYQEWKKRGLTIIQEPIKMDFGINFVITDPDGHRLRVYEHSS